MTSFILDYHLLSVKTWSIWFYFSIKRCPRVFINFAIWEHCTLDRFFGVTNLLHKPHYHYYSRLLFLWILGENQSEECYAIGWGAWEGQLYLCASWLGLVGSCGTELNSQVLPRVSCNWVRWFKPDSQWLNGKTWQHWTTLDTNVSYRCQTATEGCPYPAIVCPIEGQAS
jgi:hypothetical protein